jgi:hypothetical protein
LQGAEESRRAGDPEGREAELAEVLLPLLEAHTPFALEGGKDRAETVLPVLREFESLPHGVDDPAEDGLPGGPGAIALAELLHGRGLLPMARRLGFEHLVNGVEHDPAQSVPAVRPALYHANEIVDEDVDVRQRLGQYTVGDPGLRSGCCHGQAVTRRDIRTGCLGRRRRLHGSWGMLHGSFGSRRFVGS